MLKEICGTLILQLLLIIIFLIFLLIFTQIICEIGRLTNELKTNISDAGARQHAGLG